MLFFSDAGRNLAKLSRRSIGTDKMRLAPCFSFLSDSLGFFSLYRAMKKKKVDGL